MKTNIWNRILIFLAFNIYKIATIFFGGAFILVLLNYLFFSYPFLIISYFFWFAFGFFVFSFLLKKANSFLQKKYEENDRYYLDLLKNTLSRPKKKASPPRHD